MSARRLFTDQIRDLTPQQKDTALLVLAFRVQEDDWKRAMELAQELNTQEKAS